MDLSGGISCWYKVDHHGECRACITLACLESQRQPGLLLVHVAEKLRNDGQILDAETLDSIRVVAGLGTSTTETVVAIGL